MVNISCIFVFFFSVSLMCPLGGGKAQTGRRKLSIMCLGKIASFNILKCITKRTNKTKCTA